MLYIIIKDDDPNIRDIIINDDDPNLRDIIIKDNNLKFIIMTEETLIGQGELGIICVGLIFISCIIYLVIKTHIDFYRDVEEKEKFVKELKVGDKFMSDVQLINEDPFKEKQNLITIEVLDIKKNEYGEYWAKVKWSDDNITTMQAMQIYEDFTKI